MKQKILMLLIVATTATLNAAPPENYYSSLNGKSGTDLQNAVSAKISNHTSVGYDGLYTVYQKSDVRANGFIWDMYSDCSFNTGDKCGSYQSVCDCFNREHSVPQSWGLNSVAKADAYHVLPTDGKVNNQRSAYPYGECSGGTRLDNRARGKLGSSTFAGYSGKVFEPDDEYKGDIARSYFYMLCAYKNLDFTSNGGNAIFAGPGKLTTYGLNLLLKWHRQDPVSQKELDRNDAINSFQNNRNPFIDYPCLVEYIWGNNKNEAVNINDLMSAYSPEYAASDLTGCYNKPTTPTILTPKNGTVVNIGYATLNNTISQNITITAALLEAPLTLKLSGADANMFSLSTNTIPAATANQGTDISVNYTPTTIGNHTATLTLSSTNSNTITITIQGACVASLVSPTNDIIITNNNVGDTYRQPILIKGTNLTNDIQLTIAGTHQSQFSLSATQLTASQANEGTNIELYYTPAAVGTHQATLSITSPDFNTKTIHIQGTCLFQTLPVTHITYHSAQLNWTDAGTTNYIVNVYQKQTTGTEETLIFTDQCADTKGTTDGYTAVEDGALRMGSSSKTGSVTYSNIDLSAGGRIEYQAMQYRNDVSNVEVRLGNRVIATQQLSSSFETYTIEVEPNDAYRNTTLTFTTIEKSKRVILSNVSIFVGGETTENISIPGYPQNVGNVLQWTVNRLDSLTDYYFTVQPEGQPASEEDMFITDNSNTTALSSNIYDGITYTIHQQTIQLTRIPQNATLHIYNALGQLITTLQPTNSQTTITLPQGLYLIQHNQQTIKIIIP